MKVYILTHHWDGKDENVCENVAAFSDINKARIEMLRRATDEKADIERNYYGCVWDQDLTWTSDNVVCYGWYGKGREPDWSWIWEIETMEVI